MTTLRSILLSHKLNSVISALYKEYHHYSWFRIPVNDIKNYITDEEFSQLFPPEWRIASLLCYRMYIATYEPSTIGSKTKNANQ